MKKGLLFLLFVPIFLINFVSASFHYYGGGSLSDLLFFLDAQTVTLVSIFLISFVLIFFAMTKTIFKDYRGIAAVIALSLAFLLMFEYNRRGYSYGFDNLFYSIGYSGNIYYLIPLIFLLVSVLIISKLGFYRFFAILGLFLVVISFPGLDIVYENGITFFMGLVSWVLSWVTYKLSDGKYKPFSGDYWRYDPVRNEEQRKSTLFKIIIGILFLILLLLIIF